MKHYGLRNKLRRFMAGALIAVMAAASGGMAFAEEELIPVVFDPGPHGRLEFQAEVTVSKGGQTSYVPTVLPEEGYVWKGWSTDGTSLVDPFEITIDEPITFSAIYGAADSPEQTQAHRAYLSLSGDGAFRPQEGLNRWELAETLMVLGVGFQRDAGSASESVTRGSLAQALDDYLAEKEENGIRRREPAAVGTAEASLLSAAIFTDLDGHPAKEAVDRLSAQGILRGYGDGTFRPDEKVTRAEAAVMINRTLNRCPDPEKLAAAAERQGVKIADVPINHWAYAQIVEAAVEHSANEFH